MINTNDFALPQYGYLAFDALSMKAFLKQRLTDSGVFTDQNYEGSNISQIIDIFAYTFHTLIYYMNKTASEGMFSDAQIYENINRIVKSIGYNPIGRQTSVLTHKAKAVDLSTGTRYLLPRYATVSVGSVVYSFKDDVTFTPPDTTGTEYLSEFSDANIIYQGSYVEYDTQIATGEENEIFYLNPGENVLIDHFTIDVYVKHNDTWSLWSKTPSLYLNNSSDYVYELRLNESKYYEVKFGNDICGTKLSADDEVQIYYISSDGVAGMVGPNALDDASPVPFSSDKYDEIMLDVRNNSDNIQVLDYSTISKFKLYNESSSTYYSEEESPDSIRNNAPGVYRSQYRLVTSGDFENYIKTNFSNLVRDVSVVNNWGYLSEYMKYFHDHGLSNPNNDAHVLLNQVMFADACNFNNVYIFAVPKIPAMTGSGINYLTPSLKSMILQSMDSIKVLTCEPVILDVMYIGFGLALPELNSTISFDDIDNTVLKIVRKLNSRRDTASIQSDVADILTNYFSLDNALIGQEIDIATMVAEILSVDGIEKFYTIRSDNPAIKIDGLSFAKFNPIYPTDTTQVTNNTVLASYQFPYLYDASSFIDKVIVETTTTSYEGVEY